MPLAASVRIDYHRRARRGETIGQQIGNYRIVSKIGEGGMGVVYLAEHLLIGRRAAVKVLLPELSSREDLVQRFFNEARAATAVKHPGIVEVYDFGYQNGAAYIVMEHLEGESLEERLGRMGVMPAADVLRLGRHIVGELAAAHEAGIVHRDLKPDNVFVVADPGVDGGERTKLLDFGIAKLGAQGGPASYKTRTGAVLGTPSYMSPEQCKGAGEVDHRADLYAVGCMLFEMLCGQCPFEAEGAGEVLAMHIYEPPPALRALEPSVPVELEALVRQLLAKEPGQRVQGAAELGERLDRLAGRGYVTPPPVASSRPSTAARAAGPVTNMRSATGESIAPPPGRRSWLPLAIVAAVVVVGGGAAVVLATGGNGTSAAAAGTDAAPLMATSPGGASDGGVKVSVAATGADAGAADDDPAGDGEAVIAPRDDEPTERPAPATRHAAPRHHHQSRSRDLPPDAAPALPERPSRDAVKAAMAGVRDQVMRCGTDARFVGTISVAITVQPEGKVSAARGNLPAGGFRRCVESAVAGVQFPASQKGARITFPYRFRGGEGAVLTTLNANQVKHGLQAVESDVVACARANGFSGTLPVKIGISPRGTVVSAVPTAGSHHLRTCAAAAVRLARFPRTQKGAGLVYRFRIGRP